MQLQSVIELQVCKVCKFAGSKACTQKTQKIQKLHLMKWDSLTMNAQQSTGAQGYIQ